MLLLLSQMPPKASKNISGKAKNRGRPRKNAVSTESSAPSTSGTPQPDRPNRPARAHEPI